MGTLIAVSRWDKLFVLNVTYSSGNFIYTMSIFETVMIRIIFSFTISVC